jgi:hypothetical protein
MRCSIDNEHGGMACSPGCVSPFAYDAPAREGDAPWLNGDWEDPYEDVTDAAWEDDCWSESLRDYIR